MMIEIKQVESCLICRWFSCFSDCRCKLGFAYLDLHDRPKPGPDCHPGVYELVPVDDLEKMREENEQLKAERDTARADMTTAIGALQELSMAPEDAGVMFSVADAKGKIIIEPRRVEGIFDALEKHASKMLPWGKAAVESHYAIDDLRSDIKDLTAENEKLRIGIRAAFDMAGNRWSEWGCRAEWTHEILEKTLDENNSNQPD